ncbi:hypothetical protein BDW74DRAFT_181224 [Aspergillus multicolor]|uniref:uncharacterized protein n=1 Tax=Aspergillus multicolor TaxID=41759 RepID=UPI003CCD6460
MTSIFSCPPLSIRPSTPTTHSSTTLGTSSLSSVNEMHDPDCSCSYEIYLRITTPAYPLGRLWTLVLVDAATQKAIWYWAKPETAAPPQPGIWPWSKPDPTLKVNYIRTRSKRLDLNSSTLAETVSLGTIQAKDYKTFQKVFYDLEVTWNKKFVAMFMTNLAQLGLVESHVARDILLASWVGGYEWRSLNVRIPADEEASSDEEGKVLNEHNLGTTFESSREGFFGVRWQKYC